MKENTFSILPEPPEGWRQVAFPPRHSLALAFPHLLPDAIPAMIAGLLEAGPGSGDSLH